MMMNEAMRSTPSLVLYLDPFQLMRVAKEDIKLAEMMFRQSTKKMLINEERKAMQNQQQTIEGQIASAQAAEEAKRETQAQAGQIEMEKTKMSGDIQSKNTVLTMIASLLKPSTDGVASSIPATLQPLVNAVIDNVMVSTVASTEEQKKKILAEMQMAREQEMMQQQEQQQMQSGMD